MRRGVFGLPDNSRPTAADSVAVALKFAPVGAKVHRGCGKGWRVLEVGGFREERFGAGSAVPRHWAK